MRKFFYALLLMNMVQAGAYAQCDIVSIVPDTIKLCAGATTVLSASVSGTSPVLSTAWTPVTGLSDATILTPTLTVGTSAWYVASVRSRDPTNLVVNGDFSAGNSGFTSSYTYAAPPSSILLENFYTVYTNPFGVHTGFTSFVDHTTGTGNMMILNGSPTPVDVWCQTIAVTPNTDYDFSAWFANCSSTLASPPILQFKINGVLQGTPITVSSPLGVWANFFTTWNSGTSTSATICIYDVVTTASGNDFVIDDISFQKICVSKDSVYVKVVLPDTTHNATNDTICAYNAPLTLNAPSGHTSYTWNTGATTSSINVSTAGDSWVYSTTGCSTIIDTFHVTFITAPVVALGNDTSFCEGNTLVLQSVQPAGSTYLWENGNTGDSIHVSATGPHSLTVTALFGCTTTDVINITVSPHPIVDLGPDTLNCLGAAVPLQSSGTYTVPVYQWSTGSTTATTTAYTTATYWLTVTENGCPTTDTIHVTILYDTFTLHTTDTAICRGRTVQALISGDPMISYQWVPTTGMAVSNISSPAITPDTSAMYVVTASMAGCPDRKDSFFIDVQPTPTVYVGGNRFVCEFDKLPVKAFVDPPWYQHYTYSWTPAGELDDPTLPAVMFSAGHTTTVILTVSTPAGCIGADSAQLIVLPGNFGTIHADTSVCPHDSIQLWASGGVAYQWRPDRYLDDAQSATPAVKAITTEVYTVIATSQYGCFDTLSVRVTIHPSAVMYLGDSVTIYPGETYQIAPQTNCVNFLWSPPAGLTSRYISNPIASPEVNTRYIVRGETEWGCMITDTLNIRVDPSELIAVPNAFTPGAANGANNKLYVLRRGLVQLNYFHVYNRWGNLVYTSSDIDAGWDGTFNGKPQPLDVYVYQVQAISTTGAVINKSGNVTLLR